MGNNAYKRRHIAQGLCQNCSNPAIPGTTRCKLCTYKKKLVDKHYYNQNTEKILSKHTERRKKYIAEGRCPKCGAPLLDDETYIQCINCREHLYRL